MDKDKIKEHIILQHLAENNPELLRRIVDNPVKTLSELGMSEDSLRCPEEAHSCLRQGQQLANRIQSIATDPIRDLPKISQLVRDTFGEEFEIKKIPFGIQFREKVKSMGTNWTITGTVALTLGSTKCMLNAYPDHGE